MRLRVLIMTLSLLLVAIALPASVATAWSPGCPPAKHVVFKGPWDGGNWYFPKWSSKRPALRLAIVHVWANLDNPLVKNNKRNPGNPPWGQRLVKVKIHPKILRRIGAKRVRLFGLGGEAWIYKAGNKACRNLKFFNSEFANGDLPKRTLARLADEGLAYPY